MNTTLSGQMARKRRGNDTRLQFESRRKRSNEQLEDIAP